MRKDELEHYEAQEALQRRQLEAQGSSYSPQLMEQVQQVQAVLVDQTNPRRIVEDIMLRLQGKRKMPDGSQVRVAEPKMNKKGIENVWFILDSHINQNVILSRLDIKEVANIIDSLQDDLVDDLALNWKVYGITSKTDLDNINNSILVNIYVALKRAEGQNEKNWLGKISIENISSAPKFPKAKKEGFWSKFR